MPEPREPAGEDQTSRRRRKRRPFLAPHQLLGHFPREQVARDFREIQPLNRQAVGGDEAEQLFFELWLRRGARARRLLERARALDGKPEVLLQVFL